MPAARKVSNKLWEKVKKWGESQESPTKRFPGECQNTAKRRGAPLEELFLIGKAMGRGRGKVGRGTGKVGGGEVTRKLVDGHSVTLFIIEDGRESPLGGDS